MRGECSVKSNVRADIKIDRSRVEDCAKTFAHMRFIYTGPHLPLDSIAQVRFKAHTRPRGCHRSLSTYPTRKLAKPVHQPSLARYRAAAHAKAAKSVGACSDQSCIHIFIRAAAQPAALQERDGLSIDEVSLGLFRYTNA